MLYSGPVNFTKGSRYLQIASELGNNEARKQGSGFHIFITNNMKI